MLVTIAFPIVWDHWWTYKTLAIEGGVSFWMWTNLCSFQLLDGFEHELTQAVEQLADEQARALKTEEQRKIQVKIKTGMSK